MFIKSFFELIFKPEHVKKWQILFWLNGALLLYLTLMPSVQHQVTVQNIDKVFHFIGFGAFAFFCVLAFPKLSLLKVIILSSILGVGVEIIQSQIPHRSLSIADMLADFAGIITAVGFLWLGRKK